MTTMLTPETLLRGYAAGIFPMSEGRDDPEIFWVDPRERGVMPLDGFHISRSLGKHIAKEPFQIRINTAFDAVVEGCADRDETWINGPIATLYSALHRAGYAHALEVWEDKTLVGGVYGVTLGAAFFGESMFFKRSGASKIAFMFLIEFLQEKEFILLDSQYLNDHTASLGAIEISKEVFMQKLDLAINDV